MKTETQFRPRPLSHYLNALSVCDELARNPEFKKAIAEISQILQATAKQWPKFFQNKSRRSSGIGRLSP